ncbi:MAG TPA: T9SS type A sorting domain-containing protein [Bacteroidales bacterium]|nr:T9SS type A sorting domain-containing protein [Bacteroidales bacterium]HPS16468.1 T9SS type A sorting domain-containing protein [Bacteroidales bacterium]
MKTKKIRNALLALVLIATWIATIDVKGQNGRYSGQEIMTQTGELVQAYSYSGCGLNYTTGSVKLAARHLSPTSVTQPASINITGIPNNAIIVKAFITWVIDDCASSYNNCNVQFYNTSNTSYTINNVPYLVSSPTGNGWMYGIRSFETEVTNYISLPYSGTYKVNLLPTANYQPPYNPDTDGATLFIIYKIPNSNFIGNINIYNGMIQSNGSSTMSQQLSGLNIINTPNNPKAFLLLADFQDNAYGPNQYPSVTYNNINTINFLPNFWNFEEQATNLTQNQSTYNFTINIPLFGGGYDVGSLHLAGIYYQSPIVDAGNNQAICSAGQCATLTATGASSYIWSNGSTSNPIIVCPTTTTTYSVTGTTAEGCTGSDNVIVSVSTPPPAFTISGKNNNCNPQPKTYTVSPFNSAYTWTWSVNGGIAHSFTSSTFTIDWGSSGINLPGGGTITVTANNNGCTTTSTFKVYECCDNTATYTYNDATINSNTTINGSTIIVNGTLTITNFGTVYPTVNWNDDQVYFGPMAKINIVPGCTLNITRSNLQACDTILWDGIYVTSTKKKALVFIEGSTVKDALNAVVSIAGGGFSFLNSLFDKNYKCVWAHYYNASHVGHINSTNFYCTSTLLYPHKNERTYIGVEADSVKFLFIGDSATSAKNQFDNMDFGIKSLDSYVKVYNNKFTNIKPTVSYINPTHTIFTAIQSDAINTSSSYPLAKLKVGDHYVSGYYKSNLFQNCENGICTNDNYFVDITENNLEYTIIGNNWGEAIYTGSVSQSSAPVEIYKNTLVTYKRGIHVINSSAAMVKCNIISIKAPITSQSYETRGILAENCQSATIAQNTVTGPSGGNGDWRITGIRADGCPGTIMQCNSSSSVGRGIIFGGVCTPGTDMSKNDMTNYMDGLFLNWCVMGQQGSSGYPTDNTWWVTGSRNSDTYAYNSYGNQSPFYVRNTGGVYVPTINTFTIGYPPVTINQTTGYSYVRCNYCSGGAMSMSQTEAEVPVIDKTDEYTAIIENNNDALISSENKWLMRYFLYKNVLSENQTTTSIVSNFMQANQDSDIGKLVQVNNFIENGEYAKAQEEISSITSSSTMADNLIGFYKLYSEKLISDNKYLLTDADKPVFAEIAQQCPYQYGPAVYHARAYLKACGDITEYINSCENTLPASGSKLSNTNENTIQEITISVYPNPAKDEVIISIPIEIKSIYKIELIDVLGQTILSESINKNLYTLSLSGINKGVYICKILDEKSNVLFNDKLTVIK